MQRRAVRDVFLGKMLFVFGNRDVEAFVRNDAACVDRIFLRVPQLDKSVVLFKIGKLKTGDPLHGLKRGVFCPFQVGF